MTQQISFIRVLAVVFSGTLAVQVIAFLRQLVIAAAFGTERAMDIYLLVFSIASVIGFGLGAVMENATVPLLVTCLEKKDRAGFGQIGLRVIVIGFGLGIAAAILFMLAVPLVARFITTGLSGTEREAMQALSWWFIPWILIAVPYYAIGSLLKAESRFRRFMIAEIIVTIVSLLIILVWRPGVYAIAIAYGAGYGIALLSMLPGLPVPLRFSQRQSGQSWGVVRQISRFASANQVSALGLLVDRFLASYLPPGAIAATSYAALMTGQITALLGFREAFMVPLSAERDRSEKFERVLIGLVLLSVPPAVFLASEARNIVIFLLERGRFDRAATDMTVLMLSVQALAIPSAALALPMFRMLQILNRMRMVAAFYLCSAAFALLFGSITIFGLRMGLAGYAIATTSGSFCTMLVTAGMVHAAGIRPNWFRILQYAMFAAGASLTGWAAATTLTSVTNTAFGALLIHGLIFVLTVAAFYGLIYRRLEQIIQGISPK
jgi:putative peptidoglycan lipid II flippase